MGMNKTLVVDAAVCDMTELSANVLEQYDSVTIHAATILVTQRAKELAASYGAVMNGVCMMQVDAGARIIVKNGTYEINGSTCAKEQDVLLVNGTLRVGKDAQSVLRQFGQIAVNGSVVYPESLAGEASQILVNGIETSYPDDAVCLFGDVTIDRFFSLRAEQKACYYTDGRVWMLNCSKDCELLAEKHVTMKCRRAFVTEGLLEQAARLFDVSVPVTILPDGCRILTDESLLTEANAGYIGARVYADGSLCLTEENVRALQCIESLIVNGTVSIPETLKRLVPLSKVQSDGILFTKTMVISDRPAVELVASMLELNPGGLEITGCVSVYIQSDVPAILIKERLKIKDCSGVFCSREQLGGVESACSNVKRISTSWEKGEEPENRNCRIRAGVFKL